MVGSLNKSKCLVQHHSSLYVLFCSVSPDYVYWFDFDLYDSSRLCRQHVRYIFMLFMFLLKLPYNNYLLVSD